MPSVFISYAHKDKMFARRLAADLQLGAHEVWIDEAEINVGDSLIEAVRDALDRVDFVVVVLSRSSAGSRWVAQELDIASTRQLRENRPRFVLPALLEPVKLPGFLEGKSYADFTEPANYSTSLNRLLRALGPVEAQSSSSPTRNAAALREPEIRQFVESLDLRLNREDQTRVLLTNEVLVLEGRRELDDDDYALDQTTRYYLRAIDLCRAWQRNSEQTPRNFACRGGMSFNRWEHDKGNYRELTERVELGTVFVSIASPSRLIDPVLFAPTATLLRASTLADWQPHPDDHYCKLVSDALREE